MKKILIGGVAAFACVGLMLADVVVEQNFVLNHGWNAIYVEVAPSQSPAEVFANWPVKSVGFYDPASFLSTRQFSQTWDSQGVSMNPIAMWYRDYPEVSQVKAIPAGTVCLVFNTNATRTAVSLVGVPAAPRMTWHITDTNEVYNFVGFSLQQGMSVTPSDYFEGFHHLGETTLVLMATSSRADSSNSPATTRTECRTSRKSFPQPPSPMVMCYSSLRMFRATGLESCTFRR